MTLQLLLRDWCSFSHPFLLASYLSYGTFGTRNMHCCTVNSPLYIMQQKQRKDAPIKNEPSALHKENFNEMLSAIVYMVSNAISFVLELCLYVCARSMMSNNTALLQDTTSLCLGRVLDHFAKYLTSPNPEVRLCLYYWWKFLCMLFKQRRFHVYFLLSVCTYIISPYQWCNATALDASTVCGVPAVSSQEVRWV